MKEIKKWIKQKWNLLKGKKRNIGVLLLLIVRGISLFTPELLTQEKEDFIRLLIDFILIGGTVDNVARSTSTKNYMNKQVHKMNNLIKTKGVKNGRE